VAKPPAPVHDRIVEDILVLLRHELAERLY